MQKIQEILKIKGEKILYKEILKEEEKIISEETKETEIRDVFLSYEKFTKEFRQATSILLIDSTEIEEIPAENSIDIRVDTRIERVLSDIATDADGIKVANVYKEKEVPIILDETVSFEEGLEKYSGTSFHNLMSECKDAGKETARFIEARNRFFIFYHPINYWYISKLTGKKVIIERWKRMGNTIRNWHEIAVCLGKKDINKE